MCGFGLRLRGSVPGLRGRPETASRGHCSTPKKRNHRRGRPPKRLRWPLCVGRPGGHPARGKRHSRRARAPPCVVPRMPGAALSFNRSVAPLSLCRGVVGCPLPAVVPAAGALGGSSAAGGFAFFGGASVALASLFRSVLSALPGPLPLRLRPSRGGGSPGVVGVWVPGVCPPLVPLCSRPGCLPCRVSARRAARGLACGVSPVLVGLPVPVVLAVPPALALPPAPVPAPFRPVPRLLRAPLSGGCLSCGGSFVGVGSWAPVPLGGFVPAGPFSFALCVWCFRSVPVSPLLRRVWVRGLLRRWRRPRVRRSRGRGLLPVPGSAVSWAGRSVFWGVL